MRRVETVEGKGYEYIVLETMCNHALIAEEA